MSETTNKDNAQDEKDLLAAALQAAGHGVWHWNLLDGSAWYSAGFRKMLGFSDSAEFPDRFETFASRVHPDDIGRVHHAVATHLDGEDKFDLEFRMRVKDGTWSWFRARGRSVVEDGKSTKMLGTLTEWPLSSARDQLAASASDKLAAALHDQSQSSRALEKARADLQIQNQELQRARATAEAATMSKSMFLANMSHEIRTPMTAILGFVDLLTEEQKDLAEREFIVNAIRRNGKHLLTIINDILDLSKIEAGGMGVEIISCAPLNIIQDVVSFMQPQALDRGLELFVELKSPIPETIETDPTRLRQILMNLIGNSIKFTEHGGVKVLVHFTNEPMEPRVEPDQSDAAPAANRIQVQVMDTGIGIDDVQRQKLFHPFTQADASTTRRFGGTGLGLTISRRLSRMLGGDIFSSSQAGLGSIFTVEIGIGNANLDRMITVLTPQTPVHLESKSKIQSEDPQQIIHNAKTSVLVAEDGEDNQRLMVHHLTRAGMKITVANNGHEAVDLAIAAQKQGRAPDVILMDMQMPVMDGYEATEKLRSLGWRGAIIAITAHAMNGDRDRCMKSGCDEYLTKPIEKDALIQAVQNLAKFKR
jgi:signal transduction histidine kinase/CheY-like chemotaxis protein